MPRRLIDQSWLQHFRIFHAAICDFQNNQIPAAISKINDALSLQPQNADAFYLLYLCTKKPQYLQTAKQMNSLCQIYQLPVLSSTGRLKKQSLDSIGYQKKIKQQNGELYPNNWYNYAVMLHEDTNYQRVQIMYQRLFTKYPDIKTNKSHAFLGNYANMLYDLGKYEEAVTLYEMEIQLDATQMRYFGNCAMLYTILNDYQKAEHYIKIALNGIPNRPSFMFNYANILTKTGRHEQSMQLIKKVIKKQPQDPIFRLKLFLTAMSFSRNQLNNPQQKDHLSKAHKILELSQIKSQIQLVNCSKRILSMKNIKFLIFFTTAMKALLNANIQLQQYPSIANIISDYLIVGQATKNQLTCRLLLILEQVGESGIVGKWGELVRMLNKG